MAPQVPVIWRYEHQDEGAQASLPFEQQSEHLKQREAEDHAFISARSLYQESLPEAQVCVGEEITGEG